MSKTTKVYPDELMEVMEMYASDGEITGEEELAVVNKAASFGLDATEVVAYFKQMAKNVAQKREAKVAKSKTNFLNKKLVVGAIILVAIGVLCVWLFGNKAEEPQNSVGNKSEEPQMNSNSFVDVADVDVPICASLSDVNYLLNNHDVVFGNEIVSEEVITYNDESTWGRIKSWAGSKKLTIVVKATLVAGIDFSKAIVKEDGGSIYVTLPHPFIKMSDLGFGDVVEEEVGLFRSDFRDSQYEKILEYGENCIKNDIDQNDVVFPVIKKASEDFNALLEERGYSNVYVFQAQKNYSKAELAELVIK